jgi:hypothetical protein
MNESDELLERFRGGPGILAAVIDGVDEDESKFSPAPGKWTIREIAQHLADTEFVAGMRLRQIIAENKPNLVLFDQDAWARELGYNKLDPFESLGRFRVLREINADMIAGLPVEALEREGYHPERGALTARAWVERFASHVEKHARQIENIREAWAARRSSHA